MFCVIQEINNKKQDKNGYSKELISYCNESTLNGRTYSHWYYYYSDDCFERPVKKVYKISIHHSYRENGKVKKKQFVICTAHYYELATDVFSLFDYGESKIEQVAEKLEVAQDQIYDLIESKLNPLQEEIKRQFSQTEEYQVHKEHREIIDTYKKRKAEFVKQYELDDSSQYDYCYDVFGVLHDPEKLEEIQRQYYARKEYEKNSRRYYEDFFNNYSYNRSQDNSSYYGMKVSNYTGEEKQMLKQFYRDMCKKYHPDANPDKDTSRQMQLLNKIKEEWNL